MLNLLLFYFANCESPFMKTVRKRGQGLESQNGPPLMSFHSSEFEKLERACKLPPERNKINFLSFSDSDAELGLIDSVGKGNEDSIFTAIEFFWVNLILIVVIVGLIFHPCNSVFKSLICLFARTN